MSAEIIGSRAALLTTISFFPQTVKVIRSRDTASISLTMYLLFTCGVALWGAYGLMIDSLPIIVANAVTLALALVILIQKIRHVAAALRLRKA